MDKSTAQRTVSQTLKASFDRDRFRNFVNELTNGFDETKRQTMQIPDAFKPHVASCQRIGTYESPEFELADVLIVHLTESYKLERTRTALRDFVAHKLKRGDGEENAYKEAALVAFVAPDAKSWRFSFVRMEYETKRDPVTGRIKPEERLTPARRFSYLVGAEEECHTAQARFLDLLKDTTTSPTLAKIEEAFSVESVTKEFFNQYAALFQRTHTALEAIVAKDKVVKADFQAKGVCTFDFAKKLLGQIVFLYFIQKKGWLGVLKGGKWGDGPKNFMRKLADRSIADGKCLFNDVLEPLFYDTLATDRGHEAWCKPFACRIPFLNGGLFEPISGYDWQSTNLAFSNDLFTNGELTKEGDTGTGILDVFDRYNFTVNEAEPLEKEVAIDPEMLGKVFENLIEENRRKGLGAYYTPREIVHYMCQESLINYLDTTLNPESTEVPRADIETFIREGDQAAHYETARKGGTVSYARKLSRSIEAHACALDDALKFITVCDPAIGSGAFPVGMMTEIVKARTALTPYFNDVAERTPYHFKRHAIQNSIYGVDIDLGAVEIAKLRLWLSLVVDEEDVTQIKPLPNLDYKVVVGNSLMGFPFKSARIHKIEALKAKFFDETGVGEKRALRGEIDSEIAAAFAASKRSLGYEVSFDFNIYFSEVFNGNSGFDVFIANPPYVDSEVMVREQPEIRTTIASRFTTTKGNWDLYIPFLELSLTKLSRRGTSCLITPNKWLAISYGQAYRAFAKNMIYGIADYSRFRAFENVGVFPVVQFASPQSKAMMDMARFSDGHKKIFSTSLPRAAFAEMSNWGAVLSQHLPLISKLLAEHPPLRSICSLEEAFTVGEAYKLTELLQDDRTREGVFQFINTGTIEPFYSLWGYSKTTYLKTKYMCPVLDKAAFKSAFPRRFTQMSSAKIIVSGMRHFESVLDLDGDIVAGKSTVVIRGINGEEEWYCLLGILNSMLARFFLKECYSALAMDGGINFSPTNVGEIPIPRLFVSPDLLRASKEITSLRGRTGPVPSSADEKRLSSLMEDLNREVFRLYQLNQEDETTIREEAVGKPRRSAARR